MSPSRILLRAISELSNAYDILLKNGSPLAPLLLREVAMRLDEVRDDMDVHTAREAFFRLPLATRDAVLRGDATDPSFEARLADFLEVAQAGFRTMRALPHGTLEMSDDALDALMARGFPYDTLISARSAELWLTRGARFGEPAFRKKHPRKDPVLSYWEEKGVALPNKGLCPDGVELVARCVETFDKRKITKAMYDTIRRYPTDPRLLLAFGIARTPPPATAGEPRRWAQSFGSDLGPACLDLFQPQASRHAEIARQHRLAQLPPIREILAMSKQETIDLVREIVGCRLAA